VEWWGQPRTDVRTLGILPFTMATLAFTVLVLETIGVALSPVNNTLPILLILPCFCIIPSMFSAFSSTYNRVKMTFYVITDNRVVIVVGNTTQLSIPLRKTSQHFLEVTERSGGSGDILFGNLGKLRRMRRCLPVGPAFFDIPDVRNVERILQAIRTGSIPEPGA
jgi:hypothetical protein